MFYCLKTSIKEKYTKMLLPLSSFKQAGRENKEEFNAFSMYLVANGTCTVLLQNLLKFINYPRPFYY
jgi:hypothetical protein